MPKPTKTAQANQRGKPSQFFQKELAGEDPLSLATAQRLYELAAHLFAQRPWNLLADDELVLVEEPVSGELCYCSVMGALGQVLSLHVYLGPASYRLFKKLAAGGPMTVGEFLNSQRSVSVEFVRWAELTPPDRELLRAFGHPLRKNTRAPIFRAIRPGYYPWYVTDREAQVLAECQQAVIAFCDRMESKSDVDYWGKEDVYPLVSHGGKEEPGQEYQVSMVKVPDSPVPPVELPVLDQARIRRVWEGKYPSRGVLEVDHFYGAGMIGGKNERKSVLRITLAIDAESAFAYPPELTLASASTGEALMRTVLCAIESAGALPQEVRVREANFKVLLDPLAKELGVPIRVTSSLPALEYAKDHLLRMMGEQGPLTPGSKPGRS